MTVLKQIAIAAALCLASTFAVRAETVHVTVSYYSAATGPYFEKMAEQFHQANPGIDIKIDVVN